MKHLLTLPLFLYLASNLQAQSPDPQFPFKVMPRVMNGTTELIPSADRSSEMLDGAHQYIEEKINQSIANRPKYWKRDFSSTQAYDLSVEPNRKRFRKYIGVEDKSEPISNFSVGLKDEHPKVALEKISVDENEPIVAETQLYRVFQVRWPVLNRVNGEGLLVVPKNKIVGNIIAVPDADQTPEQLLGLATGIATQSQFARRFAENGFQVLIPVLINRSYVFEGMDQQQTHREWIYRQAFHMGRHIIGYEVQKILSAVDWFSQSTTKDLKIGVAGYGEGGLIAFYASAVDTRIDAALVSGYFNSRQKIWDEPIYRNVWGLLTEFGDAEIATLIAPRPLVIEYSEVPVFIDKINQAGNNNNNENEASLKGYKGKLQTPAFSDVISEYERIDKLIKQGFQRRELFRSNRNRPLDFGSSKTLEKFASFLGHASNFIGDNNLPKDNRKHFDSRERELRQMKELEDHVQWLMRDSDKFRNKNFLYKVMPEFGDRTWSNKSYHPYFPADRFIQQSDSYRKYFHEEVLGKLDDKYLPPNPRTIKVYDKERWTGYEVVLDVYKNLFASGVLLIPKDLKPGEKRPVVVCQHGRNDFPQKVIEGNMNYYNDAASKLADQGFIVYVPQNPYRGEDRYRWLSRKANSLKASLFSFIIAQHDQMLQWLNTLPFTDSKRIAFYGLSYGGETAMRVPSVLQGYCLSICSGDFGDWTRKVVDTHDPRSFMNTIEWEMPYFNMGNNFSYAEMAYLIFPRPFMVERGHHDMVQPDEWVAYEYAKVRYFYDQFNMGDKTQIQFFNGGHSMKLEETIQFLHKHLQWP